MTVSPTYRAAFSGDYRNVPLARNAIARFALVCGFSREEVEDIKVAAGEALNNAVEHGHASRFSGFSVNCSFTDGQLTIEVRDNGSGFNEDGNGDTSFARGRGFGIFLMRKLMDAVRFDREGSCVRMIRRHVEAPDQENLTV